MDGSSNEGPDAERLEELDDKIASARRHAEEATDIGPNGLFTDTEPAFHESGTIRPEDDDQTIAPPG